MLFVFFDFSLTGKAATLIFICWCGSAISSAKEGKSGVVMGATLASKFLSLKRTLNFSGLKILRPEMATLVSLSDRL